MVERIDPDRLAVAGGTQKDIRAFVESDYLVRSGMCPNGHGLMLETHYGQECGTCGFGCNVRAEKGRLA